MSPYQSRHLRHHCKRDGCYLDEHMSWDALLDNVFPRGIVPTDVDAMVEVSGHVLFLEAKQPGAHSPWGQAHAFQTLATLPGVDVWAFRPAEPDQLELQRFGKQGQSAPWHPISVDLFRRHLSAWAYVADRHPVRRMA